MIGQTIGHYRILEKLGAGGMGEVYRAEDETLRREVAVKVLPEAFTEDAERLVRFEREAKLLASLNHPHIAQIHSLEDVDGQKLLVMELVDGETLAERIAKAPVRLDEALPLALQIARALEAAHERGIVHRDLKPANIKLTPEGEVKVLDFGLARPVTDTGSADISHSPTLTYSPTQAGVLLGTAAYMSPEQARGQEVDKRSDIWSFGVVLWEMLTGQCLFDGETVSDILAAVLRAEPDWERLPATTPRAVRRVLRHCLVRDPRERLHDIADARIELEESAAGREPAAELTALPPAPKAGWWPPILGALTGAAVTAVLAVVGWWWIRPEAGPAQVRRFQLSPPPGIAISPTGPAATLALSRDGKWIAFRGQPADLSASPQLYLRSIEELAARPVEGTRGAWNPFFSPDGRWLGFVADEVLKKVPLTGGEPFPICDAPQLRGASWAEDGTILFSLQSGLFTVSADGGAPAVLTSVAADQGQSSHRWPQLLPGGKSALMLVKTGPREAEGRISLVSLESGEYRTLLTGGSYPRYLRTGHLLYSRLGSLYAVPFDLGQQAVSGRPERVLEDVHNWYYSGAVAVDVADSGALVYVPGAPRLTDTELVWADREGNVEPFPADRRPFGQRPTLSPDGGRLAIDIHSTIEDSDIWIYDLERESWTRLTFDGGLYPLWSPDGEWIAFSSDRAGAIHLFRVPVGRSGSVEQLTFGTEWDWASSFSPDGAVLAFSRQTEPGDFHALMLPLEQQGKPQTFVATDRSERFPVFSPDGDWVAYASDRSGQFEVYLRPYLEAGPTAQVSLEGGTLPSWNPNGRELFFWGPDQTVRAVPVETEPELELGKPRLLFKAERSATPFEVSSDGRRFLMIRQPEEAAQDLELVYIPNWLEELARLASHAYGS